jgi:hypothetical protein
LSFSQIFSKRPLVNPVTTWTQNIAVAKCINNLSINGKKLLKHNNNKNENAKTELKMLICNLKQRSGVNFINVLQAAIVLMDLCLSYWCTVHCLRRKNVEHIFFLCKLVKLGVILLVKLNNYQRICTIRLVKLTLKELKPAVFRDTHLFFRGKPEGT